VQKCALTQPKTWSAQFMTYAYKCCMVANLVCVRATKNKCVLLTFTGNFAPLF